MDWKKAMDTGGRTYYVSGSRELTFWERPADYSTDKEAEYTASEAARAAHASSDEETAGGDAPGAFNEPEASESALPAVVPGGARARDWVRVADQSGVPYFWSASLMVRRCVHSAARPLLRACDCLWADSAGQGTSGLSRCERLGRSQCLRATSVRFVVVGYFIVSAPR